MTKERARKIPNIDRAFSESVINPSLLLRVTTFNMQITSLDRNDLPIIQPDYNYWTKLMNVSQTLMGPFSGLVNNLARL